jgi:hypothetical protein
MTCRAHRETGVPRECGFEMCASLLRSEKASEASTNHAAWMAGPSRIYLPCFAFDSLYCKQRFSYEWASEVTSWNCAGHELRLMLENNR